MLWSAYALGTRTRLWFGHGCSGHRMLLEHERDYGLGMNALVSVLLEHEWDSGLGMDALVSVCSGNTNEIMVWAWMLWSAYALGTRTRLWFGHECSGQRMLLEHERDYGLGMDALVIVCSGNTSGIMVWAWMLVSTYALGTHGYRKCCAGCAERQLASCWTVWKLKKSLRTVVYSVRTHTASFAGPQGQNVRFVRGHSETCHLKSKPYTLTGNCQTLHPQTQNPKP